MILIIFCAEIDNQKCSEKSWPSKEEMKKNKTIQPWGTLGEELKLLWSKKEEN